MIGILSGAGRVTMQEKCLVMAEKLDRRLMEEIRLRGESSLAEGREHFKLPVETFDVIIDIVGDIDPPRGKNRREALENITRQTTEHQAGVAAELRASGVIEFESLALSNSIAATLTTDQIRVVSQRDDVKLIRFRGIEKVTT